MNPTITGPYSLPTLPDHDGIRCMDCGHQEALSQSQSKLLNLGLWPFRCKECRQLRPIRIFPTIAEYLHGTR